MSSSRSEDDVTMQENVRGSCSGRSMSFIGVACGGGGLVWRKVFVGKGRTNYEIRR